MRPHIVVVDDDEKIISMLCRSLAFEGYEVTTASNGAEGLKALLTADPDLLIRTGGEQRISNFLIWQSAYAEFYGCDTLWPDFGPDAFDEALLEFARRQRRFGK